MDGLVITSSETIDAVSRVIGTFEGKPFEMNYIATESFGTIEGDFTDEERLQILTAWELVEK